MQGTFDIELSQLKDGKAYEYDWKIGKDFFESRENTDILESDVDVHLNLEKRHEGYLLEFDFVGSIESPCDRCLEAVRIPVDTTYDIMVRHGEEYDDSRDDVLVIPEGWTKLDVAPLIYDTLLLEIPLRCVHAEGECNAEMTERLS